MQFVGGKAVFIDTLSFEMHLEGRPWVAYRQFCQHFLAPLVLCATTDIRLSQLLRVFVDGIPLDLAATLLPISARIKPTLAMHIVLHARAQRRFAARASSQQRQISKRALLGVLDSLTGAVRALRWTPKGDWSNYYAETNYSEAASGEKERLVAAMLEQPRPAMVWDLGANTGRFSRLASRKGALTIAFDADPGAVEKNYLEDATSDTHLLPRR